MHTDDITPERENLDLEWAKGDLKDSLEAFKLKRYVNQRVAMGIVISLVLTFLTLMWAGEIR